MQPTPTPAPIMPPSPVTLATAFRYWLKLGCISFGGPAGQIALMHAELVERRRWISEQRFLHALNYCMLLPGPEATQLAIYIGWLLHKTRGGVIAGVLFVLPSLLLLMLLTWIYLVFGTLPVIAGILYGIKPAIVAVVLAAAWRIGTRSLRNAWLIAIALLAFLAIAVFDVPFPAIVLAAAAAGALGGHFLPGCFKAGGGHGSKQATYGPALIDDDTPTPAHARFSWLRIARTLATGLVLGIGAWLLLAWLGGAESVNARLGWFFTKAALLTFGGAYAVLPYVYQGAVDHFHWLGAGQMMDGLALGETTPGPLIMIVAFVGYVAGWNDVTAQASGVATQVGAAAPASAAFAAAAGACVATWFTFLPSFIFILAGGPVVESTRGNVRLTAPLTGISAAVVGVIVSLAVFFAQHVFHTGLPLARWDWMAAGIAAAAGVALMRFKIGTVPVLAACAAAGLVVSYLTRI